MTNEEYKSATQLAVRYNVTPISIWRWAKNDPSFPKPKKLSPRCTRWLLSELEAWEKVRTQTKGVVQ